MISRLTGRQLRIGTDPGGLVLDSCIGSGTTAVACLNTGRDFIGFELDQRFFLIAQRRVHDHRCRLHSCP